MKFKSRTFLRNFGVLTLLIAAGCVSLCLFIARQNLKNEIIDANHGVVFVTSILKQQAFRDNHDALQALLTQLVTVHPEVVYAYIRPPNPGKTIFYSIPGENNSPFLEKKFNTPGSVKIHKTGYGDVQEQLFENAAGEIFHEISRQIGENSGTFHLCLSRSAINQAVYPQVRVIIFLGFLLLVLGGLVIYGIARVTDTEAHRAEKAIQESEEKYRSLANQVPVGIYRTAENGQILYANPALAAMLGYDSIEELLAVSVQNTFVEPQQREKYLNRWKKNKGILSIENKLITRDGREIWVRDTGKAVANDKGEILYFDGIIEDITASKRSEEMRERLEEQLRQAQKMEAIGNLAGGIAHDFNNILSVIIGYSEMTRENIPEGSRNRTNMEKVMVACERAKEMVKHILTFSRKTEMERKPVSLNEIVEEALRLLRSALPATIEIRQDIPRNSSAIMANWTEIHQVIMNLCTNAAHAMRETGGILEILLKEIHLDPQDIELKDLQPGRYQRLTISDTGHGMTSEVMKRIFEPYYTTKDKGEGTGLGLAVAHGIIKNHGGDITVYSEPGKGTTFQIYLPVTRIEKVSEAEIEKEIRGGNEHILFVDDEETLVELAIQMLATIGYTVVGRTSSVEAWEAFRSNPDRFDLLITDQTMPNMTGLQLSRKIRQLRSAIPIILCTGFSESVNEETVKSHQIDAFVMKPLVKKEIAQVIRSVLDKQDFLS